MKIVYHFHFSIIKKKMNEEEWNRVKQKNKDIKWYSYPREYCKVELKPSYSQLNETVQFHLDEGDLYEDYKGQWYQSTHPFCISCHSVYKTFCENIGIVFGISKKSGWKASDLQEVIDDKLKGSYHGSEYEHIMLLEKWINVLIECIRTRRYHPQNCYFTTDLRENTTVEKTDPSHSHFILELCKHVKVLYEEYKIYLQMYNHQLLKRKQPTLSDTILTSHYKMLDICRNTITRIGTVEDMDKIHTIFDTKTKRMAKRRSKSPTRNNKSKQQSRKRGAYLVSDQSFERTLSQLPRVMKENRRSKK